ncbi:MAG: hypothetical protein ABSF98_25660 [Bryobacteraceae bacterium]
MKPEFECRATASLLDSGQTLASTSRVAAVIAGVGLILTRSTVVQVASAVSMMCWLAGCYLAARVAIDASLFRQLADDPSERCRDLDEWLHRDTERTLTDRTRGALALWRWQVAVAVVQLMALAAALLLRVTGM